MQGFEVKISRYIQKSGPILACLSIILTIHGCSLFSKKDNEHNGQVLYTDLVGKQVWLDSTIDRIVLLRSKDINNLAVLLGDELPKKLIAWGPDLKSDARGTYDQYISQYPELEKLPLTGSVYNDALSVEQILDLRPDLVIADKYFLDSGYRYMEKFEESGLPVVCLDGSSDPFTGPQNGILLLGNILGKQERAKELVAYVNAHIDTVLHTINKKKPTPPTVYLEAGSGGPDTFAQTYGKAGIPPTYTSWGTVLDRLQVRNIAEDIGSKMERANPEFVLTADPEVVIITGQHWNNMGAMKLGDNITKTEANELLHAFSTRPGWQGLQAVRNKRFHSIYHASNSILCFASIQALATYFYPDDFKSLGPERNLKEFYRKFMPIPYSGVWMCTLE